MLVLGINAIYHDPAAALVADGTVAAAEKERFSRREHGRDNVAFAAWELPEQAAAWCLAKARITAADLDAVAYSYGRYDGTHLTPYATQQLPHSRPACRTRTSPPTWACAAPATNTKVMALAGYGTPRLGSAPVDALALGPFLVQRPTP